MYTKHGLVLLVAGLFVGSVLGSCGSGADDAGGNLPAEVTEAPEATEAPLAQDLGQDTEYVTVSDDTGIMTVEIPATWTEIDTAARVNDNGATVPTILASPDLDGFFSSYDTPGVWIEMVPTTVSPPYALGAWIEVRSEADRADCSIIGEEDEGSYAIMLLRCDGGRGLLQFVAEAYDDYPGPVMLVLQFPIDDDVALMAHITETFVVNAG